MKAINAINQLLADEMWKSLRTLESAPSPLQWQQFLHTFKGNAGYCNLPWLPEFLATIDEQDLSLIDKIQVTKRELMKQHFVSQDQELTWDEAIRWLRDTSLEASFHSGKEIYPLTVNIVPQIKTQIAPKAILPYFIHLIHNSLEHGIECPAVRKIKEKPLKGRLWIEVVNKEGHQYISFGDDGMGTPAGRLEILGSSPCPTMDKKFLWSGKGLGLYDLTQQINALGGAIKFSSTPFQGFKVEMMIPLSQKMVKAA